MLLHIIQGDIHVACVPPYYSSRVALAVPSSSPIFCLPDWRGGELEASTWSWDGGVMEFSPAGRGKPIDCITVLRASVLQAMPSVA